MSTSNPIPIGRPLLLHPGPIVLAYQISLNGQWAHGTIEVSPHIAILLRWEEMHEVRQPFDDKRLEDRVDRVTVAHNNSSHLEHGGSALNVENFNCSLAQSDPPVAVQRNLEHVPVSIKSCLRSRDVSGDPETPAYGSRGHVLKHLAHLLGSVGITMVGSRVIFQCQSKRYKA